MTTAQNHGDLASDTPTMVSTAGSSSSRPADPFLAFRCKHARDQHVIPLHEGWMMKQGQLGESFKRRYFVLLPDVWTCPRTGSRP